jgi:hypothetical protein
VIEIPLDDLVKRLGKSSWKLLEILEANPHISKKDLHDKFGHVSRAKFNQEYSKVYGSCLVDEKKDQDDTRYLVINLTKYGKEILKLKSKQTY